ncbi:ubiquinone anaerobic biosynthesis accessory factor UbiT [Parapusillimonas granuli]|uniref:Ubiquinone biosynthesis accessory factor UbiT n=1 Tax=Parapusillimonas granuli TaxID=380911 RepID=A0A853FXU4_9BURK|nr:SCP2 sterol-binding domain-containing protein [Parapusillimonas granuli]MBB5215856.1 putative lipid carrier protein YhbT [Parapusillimonas granuli]MEB2399453.1 SCP2 sterol-binding domain-containing protein [Alcaligenaceae bacterium]NYT50845.1 SCP2 sterol-binding domain-containing protein [Parapusillimonas granuli]
MNATAYRLPEPVAKLLSVLPAFPGSLLFVQGLNLFLARHLPADTLQALDGEALRIRVRDAGVQFDFTWKGRGFVAARHQAEPALTIAATAHDFLLLMQRKEDPDTLFFSRRLVMEGDTELGLLVKNTLDAIDLPALHPRNLFSRR